VSVLHCPDIILKMKALQFGMLTPVPSSAQCHISKDLNLQQQCCDNLTFCVVQAGSGAHPVSTRGCFVGGAVTKVLRYPLTSPSSVKVRNEWSLPPPSYTTLLHAQEQLYFLSFLLQTGHAEFLVSRNQIMFNITYW
jgi:hypothetical protein